MRKDYQEDLYSSEQIFLVLERRKCPGDSVKDKTRSGLGEEVCMAFPVAAPAVVVLNSRVGSCSPPSGPE